MELRKREFVEMMYLADLIGDRWNVSLVCVHTVGE